MRADERTQTADLLITSVRCTSGLFSGLPILLGLSPSDSSQCLSDAGRTTGLPRERWGVESRTLAQPCQQVEYGILGAPLWHPTELLPGTTRVHNGGAEG
jgi:hypothetical protein